MVIIKVIGRDSDSEVEERLDWAMDNYRHEYKDLVVKLLREKEVLDIGYPRTKYLILKQKAEIKFLYNEGSRYWTIDAPTKLALGLFLESLYTQDYGYDVIGFTDNDKQRITSLRKLANDFLKKAWT